ncbi:hypothetical protein PINS_up012087 [Pythium insidiosum]|nr:hypothetical protein PINS_up012087 [Pythium insidiosum]
MKVLCTIGAMLVSTLALVAPVHAAQCTQDQALAFTTVLMEVASSPDCASITITDPAISDLCKAPKCAAAFRAKLDRFPDCVAQGENIRAQVKKMTNCGGSSAASSLGATTAIAVTSAALSTTIALVLA